MLFHSASYEDTEKIARSFAPRLKAGSILAFFGDLGTGKTAFIRSLSQHVAGIEPEMVSSPTFQYLNIYTGTKTIYHFDLYRLKNSSDFLFMGFDELLYGQNISCIEWAERIDDILPQDAIRISITHCPSAIGEMRLIQIKETG